MEECPFCGIAKSTNSAVILWEDEDVMAFLERAPIREGHAQIITRAHYETFDSTPPELASKILRFGQHFAKRLKEVYEVDRVAFLFTGGDIPHVHAHVYPIHENTDVTSARYVVGSSKLEFSSMHLKAEPDELSRVRSLLNFEYKEPDTTSST